MRVRFEFETNVATYDEKVTQAILEGRAAQQFTLEKDAQGDPYYLVKFDVVSFSAKANERAFWALLDVISS